MPNVVSVTFVILDTKEELFLKNRKINELPWEVVEESGEGERRSGGWRGGGGGEACHVSRNGGNRFWNCFFSSRVAGRAAQKSIPPTLSY